MTWLKIKSTQPNTWISQVLDMRDEEFSVSSVWNLMLSMPIKKRYSLHIQSYYFYVESSWHEESHTYAG
ncbi:hypothetical protein CEXT_93571 [Caerostris extrusa]|uniref:Uncharacterized protein n=1 Tax=Caerostris extrusa TaxID=172846 RepID=A0AAV4NIJ5_CAEEX|nr:hypothetical protein CEXT_93571 [Caerostris extrusa]